LREVRFLQGALHRYPATAPSDVISDLT